ncbi:MAG: hypothetical protein WA430_15200, partial [Acidobacteriaceae bacterium]
LFSPCRDSLPSEDFSQSLNTGDRSHCQSSMSNGVVDCRGRVMIFHRNMLDEFQDVEPESVIRMKKWTAVSCTVIVVLARVLWGLAR